MKPIRILRHLTHPLASSFAARAALAVFAAGLASQTASATTYHWDGDASAANNESNVSASQTLNWLSGGNWDDGATSAPLASWAAGDHAILGGSNAETITLASPITVGNLTIGSGTNGLGTDPLAYTISGSTLTLSSTNFTVASGTTATISSAFAAGTGYTKSGTGTLNFTNGTAVTAITSGIALDDGTLRITQSGNRVTSYPLTGDGALVLGAFSSGTNSIKFQSTAAGNGDNTFTGAITMEGGNAQTLRFDTLGAGGDITMNATTGTGGHILEFYHSGSLGRKIVFTNVANPLNANPTGTGWMTIKWGNADGLTVGAGEFENQATIARTFRWYGSSGSVGKVTFNADITDGVGENTPLNITTSFNIDATLTGNNTFTGSINVSNSGATGLGNTIKIGGNGTLGYVSPGVGNYNGNITVAGPTGLFIVDSTATQTLGGVIGNAFLGNGSPGTLAKSNVGTLILNGNNFYTGDTIVTGGTLLVNGDQTNATGTVYVDPDATLGGTGTIGGNVTISDGGKLKFDISTNSASHDKLDLTDAVAATDPLDPLAVPVIPFNVTAKALTFGDTDCTLTLTSSGGASTGTYTLITAPGGIGTVTGGIGTLPTFTVVKPAGWTSVSAPYIVGNDLRVDIVVTGGSPTYATWSGGADADADPNGDGVRNAVAWALGAADVDENAIGKLPTLDNTSDPDYLIFTFNRSDDANADPKTAISVQYGNDLSDWPTAVHDGTDVIITETPGSPTDQVVVKLKRSTLAPGGKLFARLKVAITP